MFCFLELSGIFSQILLVCESVDVKPTDVEPRDRRADYMSFPLLGRVFLEPFSLHVLPLIFVSELRHFFHKRCTLPYDFI